MPFIDPHSYTDSTHPKTTHLSLSSYFDFPSSTILSSALLSLSQPHSGPLSLDSRTLNISAVLDPHTLAPLPFTFDPVSPDKVLGQSLIVTLSNHRQLLVVFKTSPSSAALQWLSPPQTFSKSHFVYTQCQAIHARSVFPCQDTPANRIKFSAKLNIPCHLTAIMAAKRVNKRNPVAAESRGACDDALWCAEGRIVEEFVMEQSVPPYLFAFAVGKLDFVEVGPRTKVYSETVPEVLASAKVEFKKIEKTIKASEELFGTYAWERFDLLIMPPTFPYVGMENPRMPFLSPTVVKGGASRSLDASNVRDASRARVVFHQLAQSWTGNLITNKTNEHFWLNVGFTTYAERRIVEALQGEKRAMLYNGIGWRELMEAMERFKDNMEFTKLKNNQQGVDPDAVSSVVPFEKGFQFLWRIERQIGRPAFDEFLKKYIAKYEFQSIDTDTFLEFLKENVPGIEDHIDLIVWTEGTGIPPDAMEPTSNIYSKIVSLASKFKAGNLPSKDEDHEMRSWHGQEWELYIKNLPKSVEASQVIDLDVRYELSKSKSYEVKVAFLQLAISSRCNKYYKLVEKTLKEVGRMKYLLPLYTALVQEGTGKEEKILAERVFKDARPCYHPIAARAVEAILPKQT